MNTHKQTIETKQLRHNPQFAGMTEEEIYDFIELNNAREHSRWEKDFRAHLELQRQLDLERIKKMTEDEKRLRPIVVEDCIKLDMGKEKCLYLNREKMQRAISTKRSNWLTNERFY